MGRSETSGASSAERISELEREVSRLQEIEKKLIKSQSNLKEAEHLAKLGHWELDLVTNTLVWSDEIYRIFNLMPQEFGATYEAFLEAIHPDDRDYVNQSYTVSVRNKAPYDIVHRLLLKDGSIKHVNERCRTEYASDGTPLRSLGTILDITERLRMEEELLRTKKLESIAMLAGGIAHDFNNLLAGILGSTDLALQHLGDTNGLAADLMHQVIRASTRAQGLTNQLLTFSRGGEPVKKELHIEAILRDAAAFVLSGTNVKAFFDLPDDLATIEADGGQLGQVIQNIVLNARQAMPEGGIVEVSCRNFRKAPRDILPLPDGHYLKITIEDHGVGIPRTSLDRVFDPYFTTKGHGSGLGLSITHAIVTKHKGHINLGSEVGHGTRVEVYLPSTGKRRCSCRESAGEAPRTGTGRILVMDDEDLIRIMTRQMLTHLGYEVVSARDVAETVAQYRQAMESGTPFDVVIMDLTIPGGVGGLEAARQLLSIDPEARLVVSSGYSNDPVMANCEEYGFKAVVPKPYTLGDLGRVIATVMNG